MYVETSKIDVETLREDLKNECMGAFLGGGFGGALIEAGDIERADPDILVEMASNNKVDLKKYIVR